MAETKISLKPFTVPNFVLAETSPRPRQEGWQESPKFSLSELEAETLSDLCDEFRKSVFEKAEKQDPANPAG